MLRVLNRVEKTNQIPRREGLSRSLLRQRTITEILRRKGRLNMTHPSAQGPWQRFEYAAPNELWQMDFKGLIRTVDRQVCHPLTVLDDHSRFNLALRPRPA